MSRPEWIEAGMKASHDAVCQCDQWRGHVAMRLLEVSVEGCIAAVEPLIREAIAQEVEALRDDALDMYGEDDEPYWQCVVAAHKTAALIARGVTP